MRALPVLCTLFLLLATAGQASASETPGSELTNSGGDLRTGWYPNEPSITPELLSGGTFGRVWSTPVKGQVYAQPLLDDGTLFVATEANNLYALNPASGAQQWTKNLGEPWSPGEIGCGDLAPEVGVTSTPVIDPATNIAYLTYKTYRETKKEPEWFMDAVSVSTGAQEPGFPVLLSGKAQNASGQEFHAGTELQRPGLLLMEGVVYAAFGSDCDHPVWQGWVFGVSTEGAVKARWVADETGEGAGIWQSGAGLTSDGPGTILLSTGNGGAPSTPAPGDTPPPNLGESIVRLDVQPGGSLKPVDFFAPYNASYLDTWDADFASGGVTGLPEEYFGTPAIPHLAVAVGKDGYVYLLNRDNLGGIGQGPADSDEVVQRIGPYGGVWSRPGVWPGEGGWVYIPTASGGNTAGGSSGNFRVYQYGLSGSGMPTLSLQGTSKEAFGFSSSPPVITSNGTTPGSALVWIVWAPNGAGEGAQLRAYNPIPVKNEPVLRWSAPIGTSAKFALPGVGAGRLYVGTRDGHVIAFGSPVTPVLTGSETTFPTTTDGESSEKTVTLTATEPLTLSTLASSSSQFKLGTPSPALPATLATGQTVQVPITFSPTGSGPIGATLTATTSTGTKVPFGLSGIGQAAGPKLEATPPLVTFGGTIVGEHESAGATFRNVGGAPLTINGVHLPSAPFATSGVPTVGSTIEPGHSITITVTFEPTATGTFNDEIGLETTGGNEAIGLSGSASLPGTLQITNETVEYGQVQVGSSELESFTIKNTGGSAVPLTKSKPPIGGEFTATTTLSEGTTIEPGESVTETVKFAPTSAGAASGVWVINGEKDTNGLQEVKFNGEGILPPALTPSTKSLNLGSTPVGGGLAGEVTFKNTGGTTLEVKGVKSPSAPFGATGLPAIGTKIEPGKTITVDVSFKSSTRGEFKESLGLTTQAGETTVALSAFAEEPALTPSTKSLELGSTLVGKQLSRELTLTNTGNTTLEVKNVKSPSAPFGATGLPATGTKIEPGKTITVNVNFKSATRGEFNGSLGLTTQAGETTVALSGFAEEPALTPSTKSLELGSTLVGKQLSGEVTFKNTGNTTLEVKSAQSPAAPFAAAGLPATGTMIKPGETITVDASFKSSARGQFNGSLGLTTQAGTTTVALSAFAEEPALTPSTKALELGATLLNSQLTGKVTLKNTGNTTLEVKSAQAPSAPFGATGLPTTGTKIEPGKTITVNVTFESPTPGPFTGSLSITTQAGETSVALSATAEVAPRPELTASTKLLDLGSTPVGEQLSGEVTFTNTGNVTLEVKGAHPPSAPFGATGLPATGTKIEPGKTVTVDVTFKSATRGEFDGSLGLTTQAGETTVALSGFAEEPALTPSTKSLELGSALVGTQLSGVVTFKNTGNTTLEVKGVQSPAAPFAAAGLPATGTKITPGATITVNVTFESSIAAPFTGSLSITTQAGETAVALSATAEVVPRPELTASPKPLELGSTLVGEQLSGEVTFKNTGNTTLEVKSVKAPTAPFATTGLPATGTKIEPGKTITVDVSFQSPTAGEFEQTLAVTTQAGETSVALSASATIPTSPKSTTPVQSPPPTSLVTPMIGISPFTEAKEPQLSLTELRIRAKASRSNPHTHKLAVSYTLSAPGTAELAIYRQITSHRCERGATTCEHWILTTVRLKTTGHEGVNSITLNLAGLVPGAYRLDATPIARSGTPGTTRYLHFTTAG
ncbi:MAG: choice-of-anchor D domain-containing protein [Solirubrobacteraceae bacterium]